MAPENDLLAPPKQLHLMRILGKERKSGVLIKENTYNKDNFDASFSFITICSRFGLFLTFNPCTKLQCKSIDWFLYDIIGC